MGDFDLFDEKSNSKFEAFRESYPERELLFADLFSGIGYFTLQIIKKNLGKNLKLALLFEWNPDAVKFLEKNLQTNIFNKKMVQKYKINSDSHPKSFSQENLHIFQGDNRLTPFSTPERIKLCENSCN